MDWSEINEKFKKLDEFCDSLCKEFKINNDQQSNEIKIDRSSFKNSLFTYSILMPNELKPLTYSNVTQQLLNEFLNDQEFKNAGTLLRTLEKGVFYPVLHYSSAQNDKDNLIELLKTYRFGKKYTLFQAVYEELNVIELPVIKISKNKSTNDNKNKLIIEINTKQEMLISKEDEEKFDFSSTDSDFVSLNSTASNDYSSFKETKAKKSNSIESLSYDSTDSMLNSINYQQKDEFENSNANNDCTKLQFTKAIQFTNQLSNGHIIIGFRISDEFFKQIFENNWQEMSGARLLYPISASRFGLKKIKFLKRIALNTVRRQSSMMDDFNYILHAEFLNLNVKSEIYFTNFVHRLRLKSFGSISLYTSCN